MRYTDIAIVGGGLAGSTTAAMLGRAGIDAVLIDPHTAYPPDFRCEKLDASQVALLRKTGLADPILQKGVTDDLVWIARFGRLVEKRENRQYGIMYDDLVNAMRTEITHSVPFIHAKVTAIATSAERQRLTLSNGEEISARLVVLANGLNIGLRQNLGMERDVLSAGHSVSVGFDLKPAGRERFEFRALTYYPGHASDRMAYLTLFPVAPATMRANFFCYRDMQDPWLRQLRQAPQQTLFAAMPGLRKLTGDFEVPDFVKIRPVDLYVTTGYRQAGVVLVGDAFCTSCPAAGTGCNKVFTDVERLCNVHIPLWLATPGMDREKIEAFYDDEVKQASDAYSYDKAFYLRSLSTDAGLAWQARRWGRFLGQLGIGALREARTRMSPRSMDRQAASF
jgi:2-polyprenyl-6-methoxyphenol hydroxylase-like FAD-dependent oxidoreductase